MRPLDRHGTEANRVTPTVASAEGSTCGAKGNRTPDLFHAMEALYQLSYSPEVPRRYQRAGEI